MDEMDVGILKAIYEKSHNSLVAPLFLMEKFTSLTRRSEID